MKAIVYTEYGPPSEVLQFREVEKPVPGEGEVLVRVHAASINFGDAALVKGDPFVARLWSGLRRPRYTIPGGDMAGRVEAVGSGVTGFQPGDEVFGDIGGSGFGAYAEYASPPETALAPKPANVTFEEAASVCQAAVVALQGLRDKGQIQPGQKVLVNGASGGIGPFAVQIARAFGAEVTGVCSTPHVELVRSVGADHVVDYTQEDFTGGGPRYDLIFDIVANRPTSEYTRALNPGGGYVACAFNPTSLFLGPLISLAGDKSVSSLAHRPNRDDLIAMKELMEAGKVTPVIARCYPLEQTVEAFRYYEEVRPPGKVVITVAEGRMMG
jgi:NADPH:quinone reductase-like Zn-dependent oxidoreductase